MKKVNTSELTPGMIIAEDVYSDNNELILSKDLVLSDKTIAKLGYYDIISVQVEDHLADTGNNVDADDLSYADKIKQSPEFIKFREGFEADVDDFRSVMNEVIEGGALLDIDKLMKRTLHFLDSNAVSANIFDMLHCMRTYEDDTYAHGMNVALICNVLARWLRMTEDQIHIATIGGLLHDVGKTKIPDSIMKKPGSLSNQEYAVIKTHPREGYRILQNSQLNVDIMNAVLLHHERCDGSGYPFGFTDEKINTYAKLVAIADVYDSMTSARIHRSPLCPFTAISLFESEGLQKYDAHFILTFLENIVNTYLLNKVRLSNGQTGTIVFINKNKLSAPTIQTDSGFLDLSANPDITIEALI